MANLSCLVAASFSSLPLLSSSVSMANLSCLVATFISSSFLRLGLCFHLVSILSLSISIANLSCLVATIFSSLSFLSNSFSSPRFNLLRVARCCFSWSSVSDDLFFPLVLLLALSFSRLILSLSFLCSSVSEALFALRFSFISERFFLAFFFVHAKVAIAYSRK